MTRTSNNGRIRLGMVGGGEGAFIGAVHRIAARLDDQYELVAGAFSSDPERARASARELRVAPERAYEDFTVMAKTEAAREDGVEAVSIVTPNHLHYDAAKAFLEAGIHVICDKPMTTTMEDARALMCLAHARDRLLVVTYNYSAYPLIRQARRMIAEGALGAVRIVQVEYAQDWLTGPVEATGNRQASWRTDPQAAGAGGSIGDIGTHAFHLASFVTGLKTVELCADLSSFVPGRRVDDNAHILLRYEGGAKGMLWASQTAPGNENNLGLRVYGEKGGLSWRQEEPNALSLSVYGEPPRRIARGGSGANEAAARLTRVPAGHPEGYLEGFANIYAEAARAILARREGRAPDPAAEFPTGEDGAAGVAFIDAAVRSNAAGAVWTKIGGP